MPKKVIVSNGNNGGDGLKKNLNQMSVWSLAFGCIIGWGAFMMPGTTFLPGAGTLGTAVAMFVGALIMIVIAFSYSYMVKKFPEGGGDFIYAEKLFGNGHAFVCAWFLALAFLANVPMNSTALGLMSRKLFFGVLQFGKLYSVAGYEIYAGEVMLALVSMALIAFLNIKGIKESGFVDTLMAVALASAFLIIVVSALFSPVTSWSNLTPLWGTDSNPSVGKILYGMLSVVAVTPWAYVGFGTIPQEVEEFNFSTRKVIRIMVIAIMFGFVVYSCNTLVTAAASSDWVDFVNSHDWAVGAAVEALMGKPGLIVLGIAITCAIMTGMLGFMTATSRLLYSMAKKGIVPAWFGKVHPKYGTPANATWFCLLFSALGPWFGRTALGWFVDMSAIGAAMGYAYTAFAAFRTLGVNHEVKSHPVFTCASALGTVLAIGFLVMLLVPGLPGCLTTPSYAMLGAWIAVGIVFYFTRHGSKARGAVSSELH